MPLALPAACEAALSIDARADELRRASEWLCNRAREFATPAGEIERLELCLNEALANILGYGSEGAVALPIELHLLVKGDQSAGDAFLTIVDRGVAFDPRGHVAAPMAASLAEAEIGGLGLTLIRHNTDSLDYTRSEGRNVLKLGFRWAHLDDGRR